MKEDILKRKYNTFMLWGVILTVVGLILICIGVLIYVFGEPQLGINLSTLQLVVVDGTGTFILGFVMLLAGCYRLIFKKKAFKETRELYIQQKEDNIKNSAYGQKERKRRIKALRKRYKMDSSNLNKM